MKKIVLSLAGVMAAVAFAPEASAVPVFARQTGMACSACHFQHFPALNGFGRAFKAAGYTMMGAQEKVEGEHLSIPSTLNMAVLATAGVTTASGVTSNLFVPGTGGELQLFFGGKVNDFSGFLSEFGTAAPAAAASAKLAIMPEVAAGIHAGVTLYSAGQDGAYAMEMLNTGATSVHRLMGNRGPASAVSGARTHTGAYSARQYIADEVGGTGAALSVVSDKYMVTYAREAAAGPGVVGGATGSVGFLTYSYIRGIAMFDLAGFDTGVGIQNFGGSNGVTAHKATIVDGQMQGELGGMPIGFYASYGTAGASSATEVNTYNTSTLGTKSSFNVAAEVGVLPGKATVQLALRNAKQGTGLKDNAFMVGATYELSQNMEVTLHHTAQSGSAWTAGAAGKNVTTLLVETLF